MTIILSHRTAALYHNAPERLVGPSAFPNSCRPLKNCAPSVAEIKEAKALLVSYGVPPHLLEEIDVLVSGDGSRRNYRGVHCHVYSGAMAENAVLRLAPGIYVADVRLCALQAATYLNEYELVEYYCELCSIIERPFEEDEDYRDVPQRTTCAELYKFLACMQGAPGAKRAKKALGYVRDGARSPMEIALLMAIVLPKSMGGLGIKSVKMDYRLEVARHARGLTRRAVFYLDLFIPGARLDLEYNGVIHEDDGNDTIDEERRNALDAMGYSVISVTRHSFFNSAAFQRIAAAIIRKCSIRPSRFPSDFSQKQERLRQFVLRRWL